MGADWAEQQQHRQKALQTLHCENRSKLINKQVEDHQQNDIFTTYLTEKQSI